MSSGTKLYRVGPSGESLVDQAQFGRMIRDQVIPI
jgi:hypothetical protein